MSNTRALVLGALLSGLAVIFQLIPVFLSEVFVFLTILSTIPIFLIAAISPRMGATAYFVTGLIISLFSIHEGVMYICTNGMIGLIMGLLTAKTKGWISLSVGTSIVLALTLFFLYNFVGINVIGIELPGACIAQILILFVVSFVYTAMMSVLLRYIVRIMNRHTKLFITK